MLSGFGRLVQLLGAACRAAAKFQYGAFECCMFLAGLE